MKKMILTLLFSSFSVMLVSLASATTFYSSDYLNMGTIRANWLSDLGISAPETTIDFESGFSQDQVILNDTLDGGLTISSPDGYGYVTSDPDDLGTSNPLDTYALAVDEGDAYTFDFNSPISYFAFYMMDHFATDMEIHFASGDVETRTIAAGGASGYEGTFFAFSADQEITSLYIPNICGGDSEVGIDNIEFGNAAPVPEPASMMLFGTGVIGLLGSRYRKKK